MLTEEEVIKKYGKVPLYFDSYYKYSFTFVGRVQEAFKMLTKEEVIKKFGREKDGTFIYACYGGQPEDIYRYNVKAKEPTYLVDENYNPDEIQYDYVTILLDGKSIFEKDERW